MNSYFWRQTQLMPQHWKGVWKRCNEKYFQKRGQFKVTAGGRNRKGYNYWVGYWYSGSTSDVSLLVKVYWHEDGGCEQTMAICLKSVPGSKSCWHTSLVPPVPPGLSQRFCCCCRSSMLGFSASPAFCTLLPSPAGSRWASSSPEGAGSLKGKEKWESWIGMLWDRIGNMAILLMPTNEFWVMMKEEK